MKLIPVSKACVCVLFFKTHTTLLFEIQPSSALMLLAAPQQNPQLLLLMEGCSTQHGKLHPLPPAPACRRPWHPGLHRNTPSKTPQLRLWPTQLPLPWLLMYICRLCAPATQCWPTHMRHCSLILEWVRDTVTEWKKSNEFNQKLHSKAL